MVVANVVVVVVVVAANAVAANERVCFCWES